MFGGEIPARQSGMKFNDKELAAWAMVLTPDKEGMLEKKGAGRGQGKGMGRGS